MTFGLARGSSIELNDQWVYWTALYHTLRPNPTEIFHEPTLSHQEPLHKLKTSSNAVQFGLLNETRWPYMIHLHYPNFNTICKGYPYRHRESSFDNMTYMNQSLILQSKNAVLRPQESQVVGPTNVNSSPNGFIYLFIIFLIEISLLYWVNETTEKD